MKANKGIGTRLYLLIALVIVFTLSIISFSGITFRNSNEKYKDRLQVTAEYINLVDEARQAQVDFKKQVQEWKNTLLRGRDTESFKKYYSQFSQENNNVQTQLSKLKEDMTKLGIDTSSVDSLLNAHKDLYNKYGKAIQSYDQNNIESYRIVDGLVNGIDRKPTDDMDALVKQIQAIATSGTENMIKQSDIDANNFTRNLICIAVIGIILIILFTILIIFTYKGITRFIEQFKTLLEQAESGDLTVSGKIYKKDELDELTEKFNKFISKVRNLISEAKEASKAVASSSNEITKTSDQIGRSAEEISCTITNIAEGASEQAELADKSNNSVKDVVQGLNRITENTFHINELSNKTIGTVTNGTKNLKQQIDRMSNTKNSAQNVSDVISHLSIKSNEIGKVVEFINEITDQINLLALNASIEAARAGDAGRGFTVVAKEVENLAVLSKDSTQKISNLISDVQADIEKAVVEVTTTNVSIDEQATSLKLTDDSFNLIQKSVFEVTNKIKEVVIETEVINKNAIAVEKSIKNIANIIEQNAANTEEAASATEEQTASIQEVSSSMVILAELSSHLQNSISKFKV
ncbi:methyl-accepting chemotaxis protein [Clostridium gelidum]|uniref:Methyl-accepting chemotaxis protein n=1 Tax=Clostridium gelidum TaxID=704125 RepID=A0ABM7SYE2_9CLOT|nr:methyl-accepting chemotaxis protein [Clostridium gelidum]BCZ44641.1 methyl-accepting chemotaxis protein [Clostridium gelidum]